MKEFRNFLGELIHSDSITDVLMENRKETVKLAAIVVVILLGLLLYLHQSDAALDVSDAAEGGSTEVTRLEGLDGGEGGQGGSGSQGAGASAAEGSTGTQGTQDIQGSGGIASANLPVDTDGVVYVDIGGAVKQPMLAELPVGSRVEDAIQAAGGLKKNADLSEVNRAAVLTDGEKVYIPQEGEESGFAGSGSSGAGLAGAGGGGSSASTSSGGSNLSGVSSGRININTADVTLLQQLTGVGPVTAQKIVDYREQNGNFGSIEELKNVSGIGEKTFEKMKDDITI